MSIYSTYGSNGFDAAPVLPPEFATALRASLSDAGATTATVAVLDDAVHRGFALADDGSAARLRAMLGLDDYAKLRSNLVRLACTCCDAGHDVCGGCDGIGITDEVVVCRPCAGFGKVRCDFCGGTGLAEYGTFPAGLCLEVLGGRVALAISRFSRLRAADPPAADGSPDARIKWSQRVLNMNKLLSVLENARTEMIRLLDQPSSKGAARSIMAAADATAQENLAILRDSLAGLTACLRRDRGGTNEPSDVVAQRIAFYEELVRSGNLKGTLLDHPFLNASFVRA